MNTNLFHPQIVPEDFVPHWDMTLNNEQYHSDLTAASSSSLKLMIQQSPKAFEMSHNGLLRQKKSRAYRIGSALHMAVLEPDLFQKSYITQPKFTGKTKKGDDSAQSAEAKAKKEAWIRELPPDAIILEQDEYDDLREMVDSVLSHTDACALLKDGKAEQSGYFRDPETGIKCRIRPDFFHSGLMALVDVKTTMDIRRDEFSKSIWKYRYDFQMAMYCEGIRLITGRTVQYPLFLAVEKKPPFECALFMADDSMIQKGNKDMRLALNKLKECLDSNIWNSYSGIQPIGLPEWALREEI